MDFANSPYSLARTLLILIGAWPYQNNFLRKSVIFSYVVLCSVCKIITVIRKHKDIDVMVKNGGTLAGLLLMTFKAVSLWIGTPYIRQCLGWIEHNWEYYTSTEEQNILYEYAYKSNLFMWTYILFFEISMAVLMLLYLTPHVLDTVAPLNYSRPQIIVHQMELFVDSTEHFYIVFFQTLIALQVCVWVNTIFEGAYIAFLLHICGVCKIVGSRFENLFPEASKHHCTNSNNCEFRRKLKECIENHKTLISVIDGFNDFCWIGSVAGFFFVLVFSIYLLFELYRGLLIEQNTEHIIVFSLYLLITVGNVFIIIRPGQLLLDASTDMSYKIYSARWYTACVSVQRMMILVVRMSSEPLAVYIGSYVKLSFENFAQMLNMPASCFMVFYSMYEENDV